MLTEINWMRFICILFCLRTVSTFVVNLKPKKALFRAGDRQEIHCSVAGCAHPATIYLGFLADKPLEAQITSNRTDSVATFVPVTPDHEGTLLCKATCGDERKQSQALIIVYSFPAAPVVRVQEHVVVGGGLSLTCTAAHLYPPQMVVVDWLQGSLVLQQDGPGLNPIESTYRFTPYRTLEPGPRANPDPDPSPSPDPDPSSVNSISLTCRASLLLDGLPEEERSRETSVRLYAPGIREISPAAAVSPGSSVTLVCLADGFPAPSITWTFSSPQGAQVAMGHNQRLVLEDVSGREAGVYQCLAHNLLGSHTAHVHLTVKAPPSNTVILVAPGMEVEEGQTLNISCRSELVGPSVMLLTRGNQQENVELQSSENSSSVFFILETKLQHSGLYRCESSNQYGTELVTTSITVKAAPRNASVLIQPSTEVQEGQNVTISCHAVGYPPPAVTLRKLLHGVERYSSDGLFLLVNVSVNDSGLFQVNVSNELGYQTLNFTINVLGRSMAPPTDHLALFVSLVCIAVALAFAAMLLSALSRSRKKGLYKLTKAPPPSAPPLTP